MSEYEKMKAAVVGVTGGLQVLSVTKPDYGPYQALVQMCYGATCAGTDQRLIERKHPNPIQYPAVLGHESVGRVIAAGKRVVSFRIGDLITRVGTPELPQENLHICWGGFAQYGVATDWMAMEQDGFPCSRWNKFRVQKVVPDDIPVKAAPMMITWRETLSYMTRVGVKAGDRVVIVGSGANALAFVCHCVYAGAHVAVLGGPMRAEKIVQAGAELSLNYHDNEAVGKLKETFPDGVDLILDGVGAHSTVNQLLPLLRTDGCVAVYGWNDRRDYGLNPFGAVNSFQVYCGGYDEAETHDEVVKRIREGALNASLWYDLEHPVSLRKIRDAYTDLLERKALKYLIDLRPESAE